MSKANKVLSGFFWFAFAAFLCASIPHVAYFFRAYEPDVSGQDTMWWIVSFALAISIDITIFLLSMTVAKLQRQHKSKGLIGSVWVFIVALAALSWFINWEYAQQFSGVMLAHVSSVRLGVLGSVGNINPVIASAFQVLAIAYTWIADKITANEPEVTAAQLKAQADELENAAREKQRITEIKRTHRTARIKGLISDATDVVKTARDATKTALHSQPETESERNGIIAPDAILDATENATLDATLFLLETQQDNAPERNGKTVSIIAPDATVKPYAPQQKDAGIVAPDVTKNDMLDGSTGQRSVSIKDAALLLNLSESYVRTLVKNGKLRNTPRNSKMVLMSSVKSYQNARITESKTGSKTEGITEPIAVLNLAPLTEENAGILVSKNGVNHH